MTQGDAGVRPLTADLIGDDLGGGQPRLVRVV